jgi:microcin C transport system substrate-binding protein
VVLPSKWWAGKDFEKVSLEPAMGSGAYKVDAVDVGRSISYRRVADWWAKDLWMNRGRNNFEVTRYDYYRDNSIVFEAFKAGETDIRRENSAATGWSATPTIPRSRTAASCAPRSRTRTQRRCRASSSTCAARCSRTAACARRSA